MAKFLSDEWFAKVKELIEAAGAIQIAKEIANVTVNLTVETREGNVEMCINGGLIQKGLIDNADVNMSMPDDYAYKLLVKNDWSVGMRGYIKRKIKLSGNLKKLIPLQVYKPSKDSVALAERIAAITESIT
jgi:hypothetical protein